MQHDKPRLFHFAVLSVQLPGEAVLHQLAQQDALVQEFLLHDGQADDRLRGIDVVIGIPGFIVVLQIDDRVLLLGHLKILLVGVQPQDKGPGPMGIGGVRIAVDRHKKVRLGLIGDFPPLVQVHEGIVIPGEDNLYVGVLFQGGSGRKHDVQGNVLFQEPVPQVPRIMPAVAGIQHHRKGGLPGQVSLGRLGEAAHGSRQEEPGGEQRQNSSESTVILQFHAG